MKTNTTFAKKGFVLASAIILGGLAPAVAPSVLNLNGGVVYAEETHKVTIHYDLYDEPMFLLRSSDSSSEVFDVTPKQPLSDHLPETLPGGYVFSGVIIGNSGGSEGRRLSSRNDLFGNWTNIYVYYNLKPKKSRTNPSNAGTNNNEKPHKVTIIYCPYDDYPRETSSKEVDVTPNQPLSDHIPETLPGEYVFTSAIAKGSEGGVSLSSRNDLFGNETTFYVHYLPKSKISRTNPSNAGTNNNAGTEVKPNNGNTNAGTNNNADTNAGTNNNASTEVKPNNGNANAGANNNAGTEVKPNNDGKTTAASTPKTSNQSTPNQRDGWSGSSYYQNGMKVTSKWIFDKNYNSYFYLDASGNYVQNAWVGNYYLKSGGYMAKSEWIYDKNYGAYYYLTSEGSYARNTWVGSYYLKSNGKMAKSEWVYDSSYRSYYYLTSEGSYARNTWVGDYYLKSDGKMAVNERTPDGYKVDGSGKWVR